MASGNPRSGSSLFGGGPGGSGLGFGGPNTFGGSSTFGASNTFGRPIILPKTEGNPVRRVAYEETLRLKGPMLQVVVGEGLNASTFYVHQDIIAPRSEFFQRATNGKWLEADERLVNLPEDDPSIFHLYMNLIYFEVLATRDKNEWMLLCKLYVLVEKLQDSHAKNRIIDAMVSKWYESRGNPVPNVVYPLAHEVEVLYDGTPEESPARKLLVDIYAEGGNKSWVSPLGVRESFPEDFTLSLILRLYDRVHQGSGISMKVNPASSYYESKKDTTNATQKDSRPALDTYDQPILFGHRS